MIPIIPPGVASTAAPADPTSANPAAPSAAVPPPVQTPPPQNQNPPTTPSPEDNDPGSAEAKVSQVIRWKVQNPFLFLNMGGEEIVKRTITALSEGITREIAAQKELNGLIGLKAKIGATVHSCFHKGSVPQKTEATVNQKMTLVTGAIFALVVTFLPLILPIPVLLAIPLSLMGIGMSLASLKKVDTQHMGVKTVLGKRQQEFLNEGVYWFLWPIVDVTTVDMRERIIELTGANVIEVIAGSAENATKDDSMPDIAGAIDMQFSETSGIDVTQVICTEILPKNLDIMRANEAKSIEMAKSAAQDFDMRRQIERAAYVKGKFPGLPDTEAVRMVQRQEQNLTSREVIVTGVGDADKLVGAALAVLDGIAEVKGGGGKNKKGEKHT